MAQTLSEELDSHWSSTSRVMDNESPEDNFFEDYPTVNAHKESAKHRAGGREIQVILESAGNTAQSFDTYDPLNKTPINPFESARYKWRYYAVPVILSDTDRWENSGPQAIFDEMKALQKNSMNSLLKAINEDFYTAQTGKNMLGFNDIMGASTGATIGGIDSSSSTFWESQRDATSKTFLAQTTTNVFDGIDKWNDVMDLCHTQGGQIKKMYTTWSIAKAYRTALSSQGYARTTTNDAKGIGGSLSPAFYQADVVADNDCTALHTFFENTNHTKLNVLSKANFKKTPFTSLQPNGQMAQLCYVVAGVQLTTNNRRRSGVATAITGS
jgi:hypothetical protein